MEGLKQWLAENISAYWKASWPWIAVFGVGVVVGMWL